MPLSLKVPTICAPRFRHLGQGGNLIFDCLPIGADAHINRSSPGIAHGSSIEETIRGSHPKSTHFGSPFH